MQEYGHLDELSLNETFSTPWRTEVPRLYAEARLTRVQLAARLPTPVLQIFTPRFRAFAVRELGGGGANGTRASPASNGTSAFSAARNASFGWMLDAVRLNDLLQEQNGTWAPRSALRLCHGLNDTVVPAWNSLRALQTFAARGGAVSLFAVPGTHVSMAVPCTLDALAPALRLLPRQLNASTARAPPPRPPPPPPPRRADGLEAPPRDLTLLLARPARTLSRLGLCGAHA